jgi:diguanylate cyclase (GGDEF)-like protein
MQARAASVAAERRVQAAHLRRDDTVLSQLAASRRVSFLVDDVRVAGASPGPLSRSAVVMRRGARIGTVVASLPISGSLVADLERESLVRPARQLAITADGRVLAADAFAAGTAIAVPSGRPRSVLVGGTAYRALGVAADRGPVEVAAFASGAPLGAATSHRRLWLVLATLATLATVGLLAAVLAPVLDRVRPGGRPVERRRARDAVAVVGEVLASTHDRERLLQVLLATTMDVTGAVGGEVVERGRVVEAAGVPRGAAGLELELDPDSETSLRLYAPSGGFEADGDALARSTAAQGRIALENVRLHRLAEEQAVTDDLTGLANRRQFLYRLDLELQRAERLDERVAVVIADLDHFKDVNDRFGHDAGDEVLRAFATVLRDHSRTIDVPARLGGEEFAVLLSGTDTAGARAFAERVRETTESLRIRVGHGQRVRVTSSFGIASSALGKTRQELLSAADAALYNAKAAGRNAVMSS